MRVVNFSEARNSLKKVIDQVIDDAGEGIDAFMQKRKPAYKGC